jgi:hypothetical protein
MSASAPQLQCDVAVIGSGAGGGAVAEVLAPLVAAGKRLIVLEKGPRFRNTDFDGRALPMANILYAYGGGFPTADRTITLAFAEGLGGSTLVYTGTSVRPPARVIEAWNVPGVDHADLCRRIARFERDNGVDFVPDALLNDNNRLFAEGCRRLGWHPVRFPVNLRGCRGASLCNLGCPNGAKQGTAVVQIPRAEQQGVEFVTRATVPRLAAGPGGGGIVDLEDDGAPHPLNRASEWQPGRYRLSAKHVIACGGAIQTPALLLRSGFGDALPALGRYWTCHPAHILVAEHERPLTNAVGHLTSFLWEERVEQDHFFLESCMYFPFVTAKNMAGFGPNHARFLNAYERLQMILVIACDAAQMGPARDRRCHWRTSGAVQAQRTHDRGDGQGHARVGPDFLCRGGGCRACVECQADAATARRCRPGRRARGGEALQDRRCQRVGGASDGRLSHGARRRPRRHDAARPGNRCALAACG